MTTDFGKDKILERVRKMIALANDAGASEGERDNALRMAHATLAKYNLTLSEAEASGSTPEEKRIDSAIETRSMPWAIRTAHGVGELFFCKYFFVRSGRGKVKHYFVGRESNVTTAKEISDFVIRSIMREASHRQKDEGAWDPHKFWLSFAKGAAESVWDRCIELRNSAERESQGAATGTSLVLASVYRREVEANSEYLRDVLKIKLKSSVSRERSAGAGYNSGRDFGKSIPLHRQVGGAVKCKQLA